MSLDASCLWCHPPVSRGMFQSFTENNQIRNTVDGSEPSALSRDTKLTICILILHNIKNWFSARTLAEQLDVLLRCSRAIHARSWGMPRLDPLVFSDMELPRKETFRRHPHQGLGPNKLTRLIAKEQQFFPCSFRMSNIVITSLKVSSAKLKETHFSHLNPWSLATLTRCDRWGIA